MTKSSFAKCVEKEPSYVHRSRRNENDMRISAIVNFAHILVLKRGRSEVDMCDVGLDNKKPPVGGFVVSSKSLKILCFT